MLDDPANLATVPDSTASMIPIFNAAVGRVQWKLVDNDYDYCQEIARSGYADMLHDTDRNERFHQAIDAAIKRRKLKKPESDILVLDIGTGTGLLSMMAVSAGADLVVACEGFAPMANCALKILKENKMTEKIIVVPKRSDQLIVGEDLPRKADVLVAELLDTELIGEAALETYKHAAEHLIADDAEVVPYAGDVYIQVVESPFLWSHHRLSSTFHSAIDRKKRYTDVFFSDSIEKCCGIPSVFDIQASALTNVDEENDVPLEGRQIKCLLSEPLLVKRFDFTPSIKHTRLQDHRTITQANDGKQLTVSKSGTAHAIIAWWRIQMESSNTIPAISIAPEWIGDPESAWRDHWMQAVYFPRQPLTLRQGDPFTVDFWHDSLSLWFDLSDFTKAAVKHGDTENSHSGDVERPICQCGMHTAWSRSRIAHFNSKAYRHCTSLMLQRLQLAKLTPSPEGNTHIVVISDCSLFPSLLSDYLTNRPGAEHCHIYHIDTSPFSAMFVKSCYESQLKTDFKPVTLFDSIECLVSFLSECPSICSAKDSVVIMAEPYTSAAALPWDSLHFWCAYHDLRKQLQNVPVELLCPLRVRIWAVMVDFCHLWKIRAPVGKVDGKYDLKSFDEMILSAIAKVDAQVEPQPLWEYSGLARSNPTLVFEMAFQPSPDNAGLTDHPHVTLDLAKLKPSCASFNGIALWAEWLMNPVDSASEEWYKPSGPLTPIAVDSLIDWSPTENQGVFLIPPEWKFKLAEPCNRKPHVTIRTDFDPASAEYAFCFDLVGDT